jgi:hypothetical protein
MELVAHPRRYVTLNGSLWIKDIIVQESIVRGSHLAMLRRVVVVSYVGVSATMQALSTIALFEVEDCKRAHVSNTIYVDSELPEEIDNLIAAVRETEPENERRNNDAENLFKEDDYLKLIECGKLHFDLVAM